MSSVPQMFIDFYRRHVGILPGELISVHTESMKLLDSESGRSLMPEYSELVRKALTTHEYSQAELAEKLGVKQPMISLYLNRKQAPSQKVFEKIRQLAGDAEETSVTMLAEATLGHFKETDRGESEDQDQHRKTYWIFGCAPWNWVTTIEENLW